MKDSIVRFWLTHHYLRWIGKRYSYFFRELIDDVTDSIPAKKIMERRYIANEKFEAIAYDLNMDVRNVFRYHKQVIDKLIKL